MSIKERGTTVKSRVGMNPADILASKVPSKRERLLENSRVEWG